MEIKKVIFDRSKLSSSYIEQKQDFNKVLNDAKLMNNPTFKSPWFYGAVGLSSIVIAALTLTNFNKELNEKKSTLTKDPTQIAASFPIKISTKETESSTSEFSKKKEVSNQIVEKKNSSKKSNVELPQENANVNESVNSDQKIEKKLIHSNFPSISGVSNGVLKKDRLLNSEKIDCNSSFEISSYKVQYFNGKEDVVQTINGNFLSEELKKKIVENNINQMIFFTELIGIDDLGNKKSFSSMNFKVIN